MKRSRPSVRIGWFHGVASAISGAIVGAFMVFGSLAMLWWNEGRPNLAVVAGESRPAPVDRVDATLDGAFVSVTASVSARDPLGDPEYLRAGPYATLARRAEMFAWVEHRVDDGNRDPRFSYDRAWSEHPQDSRRFREPRGHENPAMRVASAWWALREASLGAYRFVPLRAVMPHTEPLALAPDMIAPGAPNAPRIEQDYLFIGNGTLATPRVGDVRLAYGAYRVGNTATLFGEQHGESIGSHAHERAEVYRLVPGTRVQALRALDAEHRLTRWMLRVLGFFFAWIALNLCLAPLSAMLDVFPPLARATRSFVALVTLPVAFVASAVTVVVSAAVHSVFGFIVLLVALVTLAALLARRGGR